MKVLEDMREYLIMRVQLLTQCIINRAPVEQHAHIAAIEAVVTAVRKIDELQSAMYKTDRKEGELRAQYLEDMAKSKLREFYG